MDSKRSPLGARPCRATTIIRALKGVLERVRHPQQFCECRHCGTTVDAPGDACPTCGAEAIACYQLG